MREFRPAKCPCGLPWDECPWRWDAKVKRPIDFAPTRRNGGSMDRRTPYRSLALPPRS